MVRILRFKNGIRGNGKQGFTLLEIMIVVTVIGVIANMGVPLYMTAIENARVAKTIGELKAIATEIESFRLLNGRYPISLLEIGKGERLDAWGRGYEYLLISEQLKNGGESKGANGKISGGDEKIVTGLTIKDLRKAKDKLKNKIIKLKKSGKNMSSDLSVASLMDEMRSAGIKVNKRSIRKDHGLFPLNTGYDLYSMGKDGISSSRIDNPVSRDDVVRFNDGNYYGMAGDY